MDTVNSTATPSAMINVAETLVSQLSQAATDAKNATNVAPADNTTAPAANRNAINLDPATAGQSSDDFLLMLMTLQQDLGRNKLTNSKTDIELSKTRNTKLFEENLQKLEESQQKAEESQKSGTAGKVFGWIATALSVIAAVAITVATFGAGAGVGAMIAASVVLATVLANTAIQAANEVQVEVDGVKMSAFNAAIYSAAKNSMSDDDAKDTATYATLAIQLALTIIGAIASAGTSVAATAGNTINQVKNITTVASGIASAGSASSGIASSALNYEASEAQVDRLNIQAIMKELQSQTDETKDMIKDIMDEVQSLFQTIMSMLNDNADSSSRMTKRTLI